MAVSEPTKRVLFARSGNLCAFPNCNTHLVQEKTGDDPPSIVGNICHIKGKKPDAPRYDTGMSDQERDAIDNLILLCATHHKLIDDQYNEYTVEKLQQFKLAHEGWVNTQVSREISEVTFAELEVITQYVVSNTTSETKITIIPPKDKITKNQLSQEVENLIKMGIAQVKLVRNFINNMPDPMFGERLKQGFVNKYERLVKEEGLNGDDLFYNLLDFASNGSSDFQQKAAGLVVLSYFFETCDVFET